MLFVLVFLLEVTCAVVLIQSSYCNCHRDRGKELLAHPRLRQSSRNLPTLLISYLLLFFFLRLELFYGLLLGYLVVNLYEVRFCRR